MDDGPSTLEFVTLGIALWGALLSTYLVVTKRRRQLHVGAGFGTAPLGDIRDHTFFIVSVVNVGERTVTIREIEWDTRTGLSFTLHVFRHSKGPDLPARVEADEELRILFDPDGAAKAITRSERGVTALNVLASGRKRSWRIQVTESMRDEAEQQLEMVREVDDAS
jgi:hypothetical protein